MSSPGVNAPSKKDHEQFIFPKKKHKTPFTRSRNKSYQQATQQGTAMEEVAKVSDFVPVEAFQKSDSDQKLTTIITSLNKLHNKLDNVNSDLYREKDGIWTCLENAEESVEEILDENERLKFNLKVLQGVVQKQERQIQHLITKVEDLTARQMNDNITISGLIEK